MMVEQSSEPKPKKQPMQLQVWGLVLLAVVLLGVIALIVNHNPVQKGTNHTIAALQLAKVDVTSKGFAPNTLTVNAGTVVIWTNKDDSKAHLVASDPYKTHTQLPTLVSGQLGNGATYRYKFSSPGTFHYHDELNPTLNGTVVVK
jgi:plastocyanin